MKTLAYDIGAYNGDTTDCILKYYDEVICIDANPNIIDELNIKYKDDPNVKIIEGCISDSLDKQSKFYVSSNQELCSIYKNMADSYIWLTGESKEILVDNINIVNIINQYGLPKYMKIDIEGADVIALNQLSVLNKLPNFISCELQWTSIEKDADVLILNKLKELGYTKFYIYNNVSNCINNIYNVSWDKCIDFENNNEYWMSYEDTYQFIKSIYIDKGNWYDIFATNI